VWARLCKRTGPLPFLVAVLILGVCTPFHVALSRRWRTMHNHIKRHHRHWSGVPAGDHHCGRQQQSGRPRHEQQYGHSRREQIRAAGEGIPSGTALVSMLNSPIPSFQGDGNDNVINGR
jgi:hypothetical protein